MVSPVGSHNVPRSSQDTIHQIKMQLFICLHDFLHGILSVRSSAEDEMCGREYNNACCSYQLPLSPKKRINLVKFYCQ